MQTSRLSPLVQSSVSPALSPITRTATSLPAASRTASANPSRESLLTSHPWANRTPGPRRWRSAPATVVASESESSTWWSSASGMANTFWPLFSTSCSDSTCAGYV